MPSVKMLPLPLDMIYVIEVLFVQAPIARVAFEYHIFPHNRIKQEVQGQSIPFLLFQLLFDISGVRLMRG